MGKKGKKAAKKAASAASSRASSPVRVENVVELAHGLPVGLDFGNWTSCVAFIPEGRDVPNVIANPDGNHTTPSFVAFNDSELLLGDAAKNQLPRNFRNTLYKTKGYLGKNFDDENTAIQKKGVNHQIVECKKTKGVSFPVMHKEEERTVSTEEACTLILGKMRSIACDYVGKEVKDIVMAVPHDFDETRQEALKRASNEALITPVRMVNEAVAAALAFNADLEEGNKQAVVIDFGGSKITATVLGIQNGVIVVKGYATQNVGGYDCNTKLVAHFAEEFRRQKRLDVTESKRAMLKLFAQCEKVKKNLSNSMQANLEIDGLYEGFDFYSKISRARFEDLIHSCLMTFVTVCNEALASTGVQKRDISEVYLAGGSASMPKFRTLVESYFGFKPKVTPNPEETVAIGATRQAAIIMKDRPTAKKEAKAHGLQFGNESPALSVSVGIGGPDGLVNKLLYSDTPLPCKNSFNFKLAPEQKSALIEIYEGERVQKKDCKLVAKLPIKGIEKEGEEAGEVTITVSVDAKGALSVSASLENCSSKSNTDVKVKAPTDSDSSEEVQNIRNAAKSSWNEDETTIALQVREA